MAYPLNGLAVIYRKQGKHEEVALLQRILSVRDVQFWSQHLEIKETHTRLIALLHKMRKHEQAAKLEKV